MWEDGEAGYEGLGAGCGEEGLVGYSQTCLGGELCRHFVSSVLPSRRGEARLLTFG